MHIAAVLKRKGADVVSIHPGARVVGAARTLTEHRIGAALVMESGAVMGILSERDIVRGIATLGATALDQPVSTLMTRDLVTCRPDDTVARAMAVMSERRIRHLPVMDGDRLAGLISIGDVVKARLDDADLEVESLRGYVAGIG